MSGANTPNPTAEARKFMFDRSFDVEVKAKKEEAVEEAAPEIIEPEIVVPTFSEEELNAARAEAFAEGKKEGRAEFAAATEREVMVALSGIHDRLKNVADAQDAANAATMENAIAVAASIVRKVFPALNERHAFGEIERMVTLAVGRILEEPKVMIYVNGKLMAPIRERLGPLAAKAGFKGEITVEGLDDIIVGDARVEWMGGGAKRELTALWRDIDDIIARNLSGEATAMALADSAEVVELAAESEGPADPPPGPGEIAPPSVEAGQGGAILDAKLDAKTDDSAPVRPPPAASPAAVDAAGPDSPNQGPATPGADDTATDRGDR